MDWVRLGSAASAGLGALCSASWGQNAWAPISLLLGVLVVILVACLCFCCGCVLGAGSALLFTTGLHKHPTTRRVAEAVFQLPPARRLAALYD